MNAQRLANKLTKSGFSVSSISQGDESEDGAIYLTDLIHVQVPTCCGKASVVVQNGEEFTFYPEPRNFADLVSDLREVLAKDPQC